MAANAKGPGKAPGQPDASNGNVPTSSANGTGDAYDDDDDDEGRTALVGRKRGSLKDSDSARKRKPAAHASEEDDGQNISEGMKDGDGDNTANKLEDAPTPAPRSRGRKKGTSFLDEILADRSKKRKKR